jgi:hypothetical protein
MDFIPKVADAWLNDPLRAAISLLENRPVHVRVYMFSGTFRNISFIILSLSPCHRGPPVNILCFYIKDTGLKALLYI